MSTQCPHVLCLQMLGHTYEPTVMLGQVLLTPFVEYLNTKKMFMRQTICFMTKESNIWPNYLILKETFLILIWSYEKAPIKNCYALPVITYFKGVIMLFGAGSYPDVLCLVLSAASPVGNILPIACIPASPMLITLGWFHKKILKITNPFS